MEAFADSILIDAPEAERSERERPAAVSSRLVWRAAPWALLLAVSAGAFVGGVELRRWAWNRTEAIRFTGDIGNGYYWGTQAAAVGTIEIYDQLARTHAGEGDSKYGLDYFPLRLAVFAAWARWTQVHFPGVTTWQRDYAFSAPLLNINIVCELLSAVGIFLLIRHWYGRGTGGGKSLVVGTVGALLFWFNPAVIWNDHCWPQWDVWVLPFFLFAALLASVEWWFLAGVLVAVGAMFKGQILLVAPIFVLWPMMQGRWEAVFRGAAGFFVAFAAMGAPWFLRDRGAWFWMGRLVTAGAILVLAMWRAGRGGRGSLPLKWQARWSVAAGVIAIVVAWPLGASCGWWTQSLALVPLALVPVFYVLPHRLRACFIAILVALGVFLCIPIYQGSTSWISVALTYGSQKFPLMGNPGQSSLAMILATRFGWTYDSVVSVPLAWVGLEGNGQIKLRTLLRVGYLVGLVFCSFAAAVQGRRKDPRFLVALITPWILFFALLPQMNNRYLFWGAALTALLPAVGVGVTLLGVVLSLICWSMEVAIMYLWTSNADLTAWPFRLTNALHPDLGWVVLLIAGIYLYVALTPWRRAMQSSLAAPPPAAIFDRT